LTPPGITRFALANNTSAVLDMACVSLIYFGLPILHKDHSYIFELVLQHAWRKP
jgi:hypothetical protein